MSEEKETKAQRVERLKQEKDGLDVIFDIQDYANKGGGFVDPDTVERMKYYGLYVQQPGLIDGEKQYFMLRVKLIEGKATLPQLKKLAFLSKKYAKDTADISTRQAIQFHWINVEDLPTIFNELKQVGISTQMAAGDCPRNTVTCPVTDVDSQSIIDVSGYVQQINAFFKDNKTYSNLPRKYKISVSGCSCCCENPEIQDLSFNAVKNSNDEVIFDVCAGGGIGARKRVASRLGICVRGEEILNTTIAVTEVYKKYGFRENRSKARVRHLIENIGVEEFLKLVEIELGYKLTKSDLKPSYTPYNQRGHFGIFRSKQPTLSYIGAFIHGGTLSGSKLDQISELMQKYGVSSVRVTTGQNIVFLDVPTKKAKTFANALKKLDINVFPNVFQNKLVTCTGKKFCRFAVSETKDFGKELTDYLYNKFPNFEEKISFSFSGCTNSCGHTHIADIGFMGAKVKNENGEITDGFEIFVDANLNGEDSNFGKNTKIKLTYNEIPKYIETHINEYLSNKNKYTSFKNYLSQTF